MQSVPFRESLGLVFGAVGLAVGMCVAVRLLRASGRPPAFRIKSLARTRQSTRRRGGGVTGRAFSLEEEEVFVHMTPGSAVVEEYEVSGSEHAPRDPLPPRPRPPAGRSGTRSGEVSNSCTLVFIQRSWNC